MVGFIGMQGRSFRAWNCLGTLVLGLVSAGIHLAGHARAHVHAADGSTVWLDRDGGLPDATLDPRTLLAAIEEANTGDTGAEHPNQNDRPPVHEAKGPGHLAVAFIGHTTFALHLVETASPDELPTPLETPSIAAIDAPGAPRGPPAARA